MHSIDSCILFSLFEYRPSSKLYLCGNAVIDSVFYARMKISFKINWKKYCHLPPLTPPISLFQGVQRAVTCLLDLGIMVSVYPLTCM